MSVVMKNAVAANDTAQYSRHNNVRIKGLQVTSSDDCHTTVADFIQKNLHLHIGVDDIEVAHTLPTRSTRANQHTAANSSDSRSSMIIVHFWQRDVRDSVI